MFWFPLHVTPLCGTQGESFTNLVYWCLWIHGTSPKAWWRAETTGLAISTVVHESVAPWKNLSGTGWTPLSEVSHSGLCWHVHLSQLMRPNPILLRIQIPWRQFSLSLQVCTQDTLICPFGRSMGRVVSSPVCPVSAAERCCGSCAIPETEAQTHSVMGDTWSREKLYLRPVAIKGQPRPHWRQFPVLIPNFPLPLVCHFCLIPRAESRKGLGAVSRKCHPLRHAPSSSLWCCTAAGPCTGCVPMVLPPLHTPAPIKWALFSHYGCGICCREGSAIYQGTPVSTHCVLATVNQH